MKPKFLIIALLLSMSGAVVAQTSPEDYSPWKRKGNGTLVLNSGETLKGEGSFHILSHNVVFLKEFDDKAKTYNVGEVNWFSINDSLFYAKLTKGAEISMSKEKTFVYLKNGVDSKYKLFERNIIESDLSVAGALGLTDRLNTDYFLALPGETANVVSITGLKFMPFSKKVSTLFADCPALAQKIADKAEGYSPASLPKFSTNLKKVVEKNDAGKPENVWLKILTEYESCNSN